MEQHDEHTVGKAEDAVVKLTSDLEQYTDDVKSTLTRCLNRAKEKLETVRAAFEPIREKAVPERIALQARMQEYESLIDRIQNTLADWPSAAQAATAADDEQAVAAAERQWLKSQQTNNVALLAPLLADKVVETTDEGKVFTGKDAVLAAIGDDAICTINALSREQHTGSGGTVYGPSDAQAAFVKDKPASTADICATIYQCLGINPDSTVPDRSGRPMPIANGGKPIREILA